jgi:hypothetical protein
MTRVEIKCKLDAILKSFNPKDCDIQNFNLDENEYDLIINTVWQLKNGIKEENTIRPIQLIKELHSDVIREKYISKILLLLLKDCNLLQFYKSNG